MKPAIITDSTAYLSEELRQLPNVYQVNLSVIFEDGSIAHDTNDPKEQEAFFKQLETQSSLPTTSQPSVGHYYDTVDQIIEDGYDTIFAIHLSSGISGTFQSGKMVLDEYKHLINSYCIDSLAASVAMEAIIENVIRWCQEGVEAEEIYRRATWQATHLDIYLMVENLDNLAKGGRLSTTSAVLGNLLKIRPLLYFNEEGKIVLFEKLRTNRRVYQRWHELVKKATEEYPDGIEVRFAHALDQEEIEQIAHDMQQKFPDINIRINGLGTVISTHTGQRAKGMLILPLIN